MYKVDNYLHVLIAAIPSLLLIRSIATGVDATRNGENLVFDESFNSFDLSVWRHEITMSGGGNWEFQYYTNNRSNSFVEDGVLHLQPTPTADLIGNACVNGDEPFTMSLWGLTPADQCTSNAYYGCERANNKAAGLVINPIQSARISTAGRFNIKYGRVEVEAKLPVGDWLWPAIWLLPEHNAYGSWPASGEIDVVESRGNGKGYCSNAAGVPADEVDAASLCPGGSDRVSSTLHWGPYPALNAYPRTSGSVSAEDGKSFGDDFHTFGLSWDETGLYTYVDREDNRILSVEFDQPFWERGEFEHVDGINNPWAGRGNSAPFDSGFYLVMNVAVGGVGGFFPDNEGGKPWSDADQNAPLKFWEAREQWYPTWKGKDSALQVKSVRIWQKPGGEHFSKGECNCDAAGDQEQAASNEGTAPEYLDPGGRPPSAQGFGVDTVTQVPHDADTGAFKFMMVLTVVNSLVLLAAIAFSGSSLVRRTCTSCTAGTRRKRGGKGYRLTDNVMSASEDHEVELR